MGTARTGGTEVNQAVRNSHAQSGNNANGDGTYDVGVKDYLANGMCGTRYQEIDSVLEVIVEI